jgi:exopolysaccharide biosynthesis protein
MRLLLLAATLLTARPDPTDTLYTRTLDGVPLRVIVVNLRDPRVRVSVATARGFPYGHEEFEAMVRRERPLLAVNGAYFSKDTLKPIGDIVSGGRLLHKGLMGTALAIAPDGRAVIRRVQRHKTQDWSAYDSVLACGPALVLNRAVDVQPEAEGFRDPHVMNPAARTGVGLMDDGRLLHVTTLKAVSFRKFAELMRALGCRDAMNLDAGASTAAYYRGRFLSRPSRKLTNLLVVRIEPPRDLPDGEMPPVR